MPTWPRAGFVVAFVALALAGHAADPVEPARAVFATYVARSLAFDASLADLYADSAVIENQRTYPNGTVRRLTIPAAHYKALIRQAMPLARQRGDINRFTDVRFTPEGSRVRIEITRYSELKRYTSPLVLVVGPQAGGRWLILEERSESRVEPNR